MKKYDYIIVGAGLYGSILTRELFNKGKKCLVIEKRDHIAGNIFTEKQDNIDVHKYGAHIFHTNNTLVWDYINKFGKFNNYINSPIANYNGEIYNLPFNMNTFYQMWGVTTPDEAKKILEKQKKAEYYENPGNLKEQAINLVGRDIYEKLIKGYTEKQWGRSSEDLPAFIIKRLPVRFTYDNNYFNSRYQGIPVEGYTAIIKEMLSGIEVKLNTDFLKNMNFWTEQADQIIYTGPIDAYFNYELGALEYRKVRFETKTLDSQNFQGNAVVNYTDSKTLYTRIIEHKHFNFGSGDKTIISYEYSEEWKKGDEPYYPVNDKVNSELYEKYKDMAKSLKNIHFGGRLGEYKYYDMDITIESALKKVSELLASNTENI